MKDQKCFGKHFRTGVVAFVISVFLGPFSSPAQDNAGDAAYEAAAGLFNLGLWKQASESYKEYFAEHPRHQLADHGHFGLGLCYFNLKDYASAALELDKASKGKGPDRTETNLYLGQALLLKTPPSPKSAEDAFKSGLTALGFERSGLFKRSWDQKSITAWIEKNTDAKKRSLGADVFVGLVEASYLRNDWSSLVEKVSAFEKLFEGSKVEQRVRVLSGAAYAELENYIRAAEAYEKASGLKGSDTSEALFRLGLTRLNHLKTYESAAKNFRDFSKTFKKDPKLADAIYNEALCYYHGYYAGKKDQLPKAIGAFETFYKSNKKHKLATVAQFYVGQLHHINKDWKASVRILEPLLAEKDTGFRQLVFLVGDSYHRMENWEKSAKYYMQFAKGNEEAQNADVALHNAGVAYSNLNKPDSDRAIAAYELLESKCSASPHLSSARLKLGIIHYQAGRFAAAERPLSKIPPNHNLKPDADYFMAWASLDGGKPAEAAKRFKALHKRLERDVPKHVLVSNANLYQGVAEYDNRDYVTSAQTLSGFLKRYESHEKMDEAAFNLGLAYKELKQWEKSIDSFNKVPRKSVLHDRALYESAWSMRSSGKIAQAIPYYSDLLDQHPESKFANTAALELAEVEFETGGVKSGPDSVMRLKKLISKKTDPKLRELALYRLGIVEFSLKNYKGSAEAFEDLLKANSNDLAISSAWQAGEARRQLAQMSSDTIRNREYKAALSNYKRAINGVSSGGGNEQQLQQQALLRIGETESMMEDWVASQKSYTRFIEENPKHRLIRTAYLGLGWSKHNQGNYNEAITFYTKTVKDGIRDDTGARAQFLLGECFLEQAQYVKARTEFSKVDQLYAFPDWQSKALLEMGRSFALENQKSEAKTVFNKLIEKYPKTPAASVAKDQLVRLN